MVYWIQTLLLLVSLEFSFSTAEAAPPPPKDDRCAENPFIVDTDADIARIANGYHCEKPKVVIEKSFTSSVHTLTIEAGEIEFLEGVTVQNTLPGSEIFLHARTGDIQLKNSTILANKKVIIRCEAKHCNVLGQKKNTIKAGYVIIQAMRSAWFEGTNITADVDVILRSWGSVQFYKSNYNTMPMILAKNIIMQTEGDVALGDWVFLTASNRIHLEGTKWSVWAQNSNLSGRVIEISGGMHIGLVNTVAQSKGRFAAHVTGICASGMYCVDAERANISSTNGVIEMGTPKGQGTINLCRGKFKDAHPRVPRMNGADKLPYPATVAYISSQCGGSGAQID